MHKEIADDLEKKYMTQEEVALLFRVSQSTVKNWREAGLLTFFQPSGSSRILYPRGAIEDFERQHTKKAKFFEFERPAEVKREVHGMSSNHKKEWKI